MKMEVIYYYEDVVEENQIDEKVFEEVELYLEDESGESVLELLNESGSTTILGFVTEINGEEVTCDVNVSC